MSNPPPNSPINRQRLMAVAIVWDQALPGVLKRGYYGTLDLRITIADGTIQSSDVTTTRTQRANHADQQPPAG